MSQLKIMFRVFIYVIAGNTFGAGIFITFVSKSKQIPSEMLWQLIILAAVCSVGTFIFAYKELSKLQIIIRHILHYLYINAAIIGAAVLWDWLDFGVNLETIILLIIIAFVYAAITFLTFIQDSKTAEDVNEKLKRISKDNLDN